MGEEIDLEQETGMTQRFVVITIEEGEDPEIQGLDVLSPIEIAGLGQYLLTQAKLIWMGDDDEESP